jgi:hypothetical protein
VRSTATTATDYLNELPVERRAAVAAVAAVRETILANLPEGYVDTMQWGMISYVIPLARRR